MEALGAVGGGEGVVDIEIAQRGERGDELRSFSLPACRSGVLQQQHIARLSLPTASSATGPMVAGGGDGLPRREATSPAMGASVSAGSSPLGRPKWASRMTLPPLSAISRMVGSTAWMRVSSVPLPASTGTFEVHAHEHALAATSASSSVRKAEASLMGFSLGWVDLETKRPGLLGRARPGGSDQLAEGNAVSTCGWRSHHSLSYQTAPDENCLPRPWSGRGGRSRSAGRG